MKIWKTPVTLELLNERGKGTMVENLQITFTAVDDRSMTATMPIDHRHIQPLGIMHGGASCTLAETVGSVAGTCCVDPETQYVVGQSIHTNHLRPLSKGGIATAVATPTHLGRKTQVWEIKTHNEDKKPIAVTTLTLMVLARES